MRLTAEERAVVDRIVAEAHDEVRASKGVLVSRDVSALIVSKLVELTASGVEWPYTYLEALMANGASKVAADWRRKQRTEGKTKGGKVVDIPAFAGAQRKDTTGRLVYVQLPLDGMDLDDLRAHVRMLERNRNTFSTQIATLKPVIEEMETGAYATVADAKAALDRKSA